MKQGKLSNTYEKAFAVQIKLLNKREVTNRVTNIHVVLGITNKDHNEKSYGFSLKI